MIQLVKPIRREGTFTWRMNVIEFVPSVAMNSMLSSRVSEPS